MAQEIGVMGTFDPANLQTGVNRIASFSSNPYGGALDIIKPDINAPSVDILAAQAKSAVMKTTRPGLLNQYRDVLATPLEVTSSELIQA